MAEYPSAGGSVIPEEINYSSDDGVSVPAYLYRPDEDGERPGILLCPGRFRDISGLEFLATALTDNGFIVLATKYRGMDFFTDDADVRAGIDFLAALSDVNAHRIGIVGHSRGGMAALRTTAQDQRVRSVVALAPPVEFPSYVRAMKLLSPSRYEGMVNSMGGTPEEQSERYKQISALYYADQIDVPVLLVCGTQDLHSPLDHSQWMYDALVEAGNRDCRLEVLEGIGHFFENMYFGYRYEMVAALTVSWFEETLHPEPDE